MTDDLTLIVNNQRISGWTSVRVTRGVERLPMDFDIELTERFPGEASAVLVKPGDFCQVILGGNLVLTGYVDRYVPSIDAYSHSIRLTGRSKCCDLVDCSAESPTGQFSSGTLMSIATALAAPYGQSSAGGIGDAGAAITVSAASPGADYVIPQFNLLWGETAYEVIDRITRYAGMLAYDDPNGNLVLARAGSGQAASGFTQGQNVQRATMSFGMDQRYSDYILRFLTTSAFSDIGDAADQLVPLHDSDVPRHRLLDIIVATGLIGAGIAETRGYWEMSRRNGRSYQLQLTTDSWRDSAGTLWTPNTIVPIDLPILKISSMNQMMISEVTYLRDESGTRAELVIMPPTAYNPEPFLLLPFQADVTPGSTS